MAIIAAILKTIGIAILILLLFLLCFFSLILFVPVKYTVFGTVDKAIKLEGKISWLLSILSYEFSFTTENGWKGTLRIFHFSRRKKPNKKKNSNNEKAKQKTNVLPSTQQQNNTQEKQFEKSERENVNLPKQQPFKQNSKKSSKKRKEPQFQKKGVWKQKIASLKEKRNQFQTMLTDQTNQYVLKKLWKEYLYLVKHFGFRKIQTNLTFSLSDPAWTGQAVGVLSMFPFFYQYDIHLYPDFESEEFYMKGTYRVSGKCRFFHFAVSIVRLFSDKQIKRFFVKIF